MFGLKKNRIARFFQPLTWTFVVLNLFSFSCLAQQSPYPPSNIIESLTIDWSTHKRSALGSDNFALTWADDDAQYGAWGDGGGFIKSPELSRVSLGIARIDGNVDNYVGHNRYGDSGTSDFAATLKGKSWGMLCVDGALYMWVHPDNVKGYGVWRDHLLASKLYCSRDKGASWTGASWKFSRKQGLVGGCILQYGKNYSGAPDEYTYHYFCKPNVSLDSTREETEMLVPGKIYLARVAKTKILERNAYEFFLKMENGKPQWTKDIKKKQPVFSDPNGVGLPIGISFNPAIKRYFLTTEHSRGQSGNFGFFEGASPWGPWYTVEYMSQNNGTEFGREHAAVIPPNTFFWTFPTKWMTGGEGLVLAFTGAGQGKDNDSFNTVLVILTLK